MSTNMPSKACPQVVKLDMAQNLAKAWVKNMSRIDADESSEADLEGRPPRLGLGAKVVPKSNVTCSTDPVERKLLMKFDIEKKRVAKSLEDSNKTNRSDDHSDNDDDNDPESRASAFIKKRAAFQPNSFPAKKKQR